MILIRIDNATIYRTCYSIEPISIKNGLKGDLLVAECIAILYS